MAFPPAAKSSKKPGGLMIALGLGKKKPSPSGPMDEPEPDDTGDDFDASAQAVFDALQESDAEGFKAALKTAIAACHDDGGDEYATELEE